MAASAFVGYRNDEPGEAAGQRLGLSDPETRPPDVVHRAAVDVGSADTAYGWVQEALEQTEDSVDPHMLQ